MTTYNDYLNYYLQQFYQLPVRSLRARVNLLSLRPWWSRNKKIEYEASNLARRLVEYVNPRDGTKTRR